MRVRFEPLGEEIECAAGETVLDAAFRHGYNLVYGCREGQCSACKCFLLEGDVALKRYSSFALSDSERAGGYALMCRAIPEQDLVIELLHYDPDGYRLERPIRDGEAVVESVEDLTHDIVRVTLRGPADFDFTPGQYIDLHVPGAQDGARRSFSMANLPGDGLIELIVKRYPGGRLSGLLDGQIKPGDRLRYTGPYGSLHARDGEGPILMIAGGSGMAPVLSLLREFARQGCERPIRFFYGARTERDLFYTDVAAGLAEFTAVTGRFVHEAVDDYLRASPQQPDVYMCGPTAMIDAATEMLTAGHGIDEQRIFVDRFTVAAQAAPPETPADQVEREFSWFEPRGRRATVYEDVTIDTQPSVHRHLTRGWPVRFEDGRGTWDDGSTALRCEDWFAFRDPGEQWERPFYQGAAALERQLEEAARFTDDFEPEWVEFLRRNLQPAAFVEHGLWFALATIGRDCLSDSIATCVCLQAAMKQRSAQAIVLYAMELEAVHGPFEIEAARDAFISQPRWQPTRSYLERLAATRDWGEVIVAANLCFEPTVGTLLRRELGMRRAAANGDTVTPVLARAATKEWEWARDWTTALVRMLLPDNRELIDRWVGEWMAPAIEAADALVPGHGLDGGDVLAAAGLREGPPSPGRTPARRRRSRAPVAADVAAVAAAQRSSARSVADADGLVGIVMAKSAEGDAVASVLGRRDGVQVLEQPSFWDIRTHGRLSISFQEISSELGYDVDAYSIQHEMSTHYGRLVATDEALMLFSDPTEAIEHLMS